MLEECDYGIFADMIIKPKEVEYERIGTKMTQIKRGLGSVVKKSIERVKRFRKKGNNAQQANSTSQDEMEGRCC